MWHVSLEILWLACGAAQPAGGVAIERRFNLARVVMGAFQIQNKIAYIQLVCVCAGCVV